MHEFKPKIAGQEITFKEFLKLNLEKQRQGTERQVLLIDRALSLVTLHEEVSEFAFIMAELQGQLPGAAAQQQKN